MNDTFRLTQAAVEKLKRKYGTPLLVLSLEKIAANYRFLKEHLPEVKVHYAMKANPDERILRTLADMGCCFDVASDGEMQVLQGLGVAPERMLYANPVKTKGGLAVARRLGVNRFTFDSESEIYKMAAACPGATALLRVRVDNPRALVDLNKKFGAAPEEALALLAAARREGLDVGGLCFHVGSQSTDAEAYLAAIDVCRRLFDEAEAAGMKLRFLDIGGGFPIPTPDSAVDVAAMAGEIRAKLARHFPTVEVWSEPGRFICGTAVNLITSVIGVQERNQQQWYFLDDGLYGSFSGILFDHWDFALESFRRVGADEMVPATFAGPSCDSLDVLFRDRLMPPLKIDDALLVPDCGSYTSASATVFNGFSKTPTVVWETVKDEL